MHRWLAPAVVASACLTTAGASRAQDAHYWTNKYGSRALLLGGAVVGTSVDLSSTFYNPGALPLAATPNTLIAARAIDFSSISLREGVGAGIELKESRTSFLPSFAAATVASAPEDWGALTFSFFPKNTVRFNLTGRSETTGTLANNLEELRLEQDIAENWIGLTWSRRFGHFGFGVSQFLTIRNQVARRELLQQSIGISTGTLSATGTVTFSTGTVTTVTKAGIAMDYNDFDLGVAVTLPNLGISGGGDAAVDLFVLSAQTGATGKPSQFVNTYQKDIIGRYFTPWSISAGAAFNPWKGGRLFGSAEWFFAVNRYNALLVLQPTDRITNKVYPFAIQQALDPVTNIAVGFSQKLSPRVTGYASVNTNRSALGATQSDLSIASWNIYEVTGGAAVAVGGRELTFGIAYGFGSTDKQQLSTSTPGLTSAFTTGTVNYSLVRFILGVGL